MIKHSCECLIYNFSNSLIIHEAKTKENRKRDAGLETWPNTSASVWYNLHNFSNKIIRTSGENEGEGLANLCKCLIMFPNLSTLEIVFESLRFHRFRVDGTWKRNKMFAFSNENASVWTEPKLYFARSALNSSGQQILSTTNLHTGKIR